MTSEENLAFWGIVAQTVPVLALALVLETRRAAIRWNARDRTTRRIESIALAVIAALLYVTFIAALLALQGIHSLSPTAASSCLIVAMVILVTNPITLAVFGANYDVIAFWPPPRLRWRRQRRRAKELREARTRLDALGVELAGINESLQTAISHIRNDLARAGLLPTSASKWLESEYGGQLPVPEPEGPSETGALLALCAQYDSNPTASGAQRIRRARLLMLLEIQRKFRKGQTEYEAVNEEVAAGVIGEGDVRDSEAALDLIDRVIHASGDGLIFPKRLDRQLAENSQPAG